jgi:hypothetical protein
LEPSLLGIDFEEPIDLGIDSSSGDEEDEELDPDEEEESLSALSSIRYLDKRGQSDRIKIYVRIVPVTESPTTTADVTPCKSKLKA